MKSFVDDTEPGSILQENERRCAGTAGSVHRTILHKRAGSGVAAMTEKDLLYGLGADYVITDEESPPPSPSNARRSTTSRRR